MARARITFRDPDPEAEGLALLRAARGFLLQHPWAARALLRGLVAEGRRFGQTAEGGAMRAEVARSELMRRGRVLWEGVTLGVYDDEGHDEAGALPSALLDGVARAAVMEGLEGVLSRLAAEEVER
jgi:hypothetical protein